MNKPNFIILGETKCGTTSLYNYLIAHPKILDTFGNGDAVDSLWATKEIRFFDRYFQRGFEWYQSCFPETSGDEITGEATPMYMFRSLSIFRIKKYLPDIKLIVMMRNPVDRLYSHFMHYNRYVPQFAAKYSNFTDFLQSAHDSDYHMIHRSIYYLSLREWLQAFRADQFHFIITENFQSQPQTEYSRLLRFLNVEDFQLPGFPVLRENTYTAMDQTSRENLLEFFEHYNRKLRDLIQINMDWDR